MGGADLEGGKRSKEGRGAVPAQFGTLAEVGLIAISR